MVDGSTRLEASLGAVPIVMVSSCATNRLVTGLTVGATKGCSSRQGKVRPDPAPDREDAFKARTSALG